MRSLWRKTKRWCKFWWQRRTRGFDDSELWNLDYAVYQFIYPRFLAWRKFTRILLTEDENKELDLIEESLKFHSSEERWKFWEWNKYEKGLDLLRVWMERLWD